MISLLVVSIFGGFLAGILAGIGIGGLRTLDMLDKHQVERERRLRAKFDSEIALLKGKVKHLKERLWYGYDK